jgi:hypothetical protein
MYLPKGIWNSAPIFVSARTNIRYIIITAGPMTKLVTTGEEDSGGHVL